MPSVIVFPSNTVSHWEPRRAPSVIAPPQRRVKQSIGLSAKTIQRTALRIASSFLLAQKSPRKDRKFRVIASVHAVRGRVAICQIFSKRLFRARHGRFLRSAKGGTRNDCVCSVWHSSVTDCFVNPPKAGSRRREIF